VKLGRNHEPQFFEWLFPTAVTVVAGDTAMTLQICPTATKGIKSPIACSVLLNIVSGIPLTRSMLSTN